MGLNQFQEISTGEPILIPKAASKASEIKQEFVRLIASKGFQGVTTTEENFQGKNYLVVYKDFGKLDKAAYAFHITSFGSQDLAIETRYFELSNSNRMKNQAKGFAGVLGNVVLGFIAPRGRSLSDELDLFKKFGQAVSGGGAQVLGDNEHRESVLILQSLMSGLADIVNKYSG